MDKEIEDKELGRLKIRVNPRAKRLIFRTKNDEITVTVPPQTSQKEIEAAIEQLRVKLLASKSKKSNSFINLDYQIDTEHFKLSLVRGNREQFLAHSELGKMQIICPPSAHFADEKLQSWLRKVIEEALRRNAKIILPPRIQMLAEQSKLHYESVRINSSRGRWGSCSAQKKINLSFFLVLLPQHLIDYVLLHELCHTREMNHGDRFWDLLNSLTDGKAYRLREDLKNYKTEV